MEKLNKNSPIWLIGLFILFAQATAGVAAINTDGWPQMILVLFVVVYASTVTAVFFYMLWNKPENFYGPKEYSELSPDQFVRGLKGIPEKTLDAAHRLESNPLDDDALFSLIDNLISETDRQYLVLLFKNDGELSLIKEDTKKPTLIYKYFTRTGTLSRGAHTLSDFADRINGTDLIKLSGGKDKILLTPRGESYAKWLLKHEKEAYIFESPFGGWGNASNILDENLRKFYENHE